MQCRESFANISRYSGANLYKRISRITCSFIRDLSSPPASSAIYYSFSEIEFINSSSKF